MTVTVGKMDIRFAESGLTLIANILRSKPFNDNKEWTPPHVATEITTNQEVKIRLIHTLIQLKQYLIPLIS